MTKQEKFNNIGELFKKIIHKDNSLNRENKYWELKNGKSTMLRSPNKNSHGFTLDTCKRFPFFNPNPPKNITKMCDGIIALSTDERKDYLIIIEKKENEKNKDGYDLQLINGKLFCDWIIALAKAHNVYNPQSLTYIALLICEPRPNDTNKGTSTHNNKANKAKIPNKLKKHFKIFNKIKNETIVQLKDILQS